MRSLPPRAGEGRTASAVPPDAAGPTAVPALEL